MASRPSHRRKHRKPQPLAKSLPLGTHSEHPCPQCQSPLVLRKGKYGLFYSCERYPQCNGAHGAHPNGQPFGTPANAETRALRIQVHALFDPLWSGGQAKFSRGYAYQHLAGLLGITRGECHIGAFDEAMCRRAIELLKENR